MKQSRYSDSQIVALLKPRLAARYLNFAGSAASVPPRFKNGAANSAVFAHI